MGGELVTLWRKWRCPTIRF